MQNKFKQGAFEGALPVDRQTVRLGGYKVLEDNNDYNIDDASEDSLIKNVIGYDHRFLYLLQEVSGGFVIKYERGIGFIYDSDGETFLQRDLPLSFGTPDDDNLYRIGQKPVKFSPDSYLRVYSTLPLSLSEALAPPYSVLASIESRCPSPVTLEENTLLGRKDDIVQSIDKQELREIIDFDEALIDSLQKAQKQLTLKTRRLDLSRKNSFVSAPYIRLMPDHYTSDEKPPAQQGTIIYNTETHSLEFYDGTSWKTLSFSEEEE
jgi:hypothetical protein